MLPEGFFCFFNTFCSFGNHDPFAVSFVRSAGLIPEYSFLDNCQYYCGASLLNYGIIYHKNPILIIKAPRLNKLQEPLHARSAASSPILSGTWTLSHNRDP